ncbi:hypothetical protein GCM10011386_26650 [Parapedobacter defluvii]|uniref:Uncharacterized protein n=1 Tax=Parapedobacter defluvii TaxID=2045106 RepID=A0ABQ1M8C6_9SPHI|nr:hypothetical protein GCM10011386_26650 [Parapedobacter defluvii]
MTAEKLPQTPENSEKKVDENRKKLRNLIAEIVAKIIIREVNESNRLRQDK